MKKLLALALILFAAVAFADFPVSGGGTTNASDLTSGTVATARGGTNLDTSASTGFPYVLSGTWSIDNVATRLSQLGLGPTDNVTFGSVSTGPGTDGQRKITPGNNTSVTPTASTNELYFEGNTFKVNENGTEYPVAKAGTLTNTNFCTTNGTIIECTSAAPMIYPDAGIGVSTGSAWGTSLSSTAPGFNTVLIGNDNVGGYGGVQLSRETYHGHLVLRNKSSTGPASLSLLPYTGYDPASGPISGVVAYVDNVMSSGQRVTMENYKHPTLGRISRVLSENDAAWVYPLVLGLTPSNGTATNFIPSVTIDNGATYAVGDVTILAGKKLRVDTQTASTNSTVAASTAYVDNAIAVRGGYTLQFVAGFAATTTDNQTLYMGMSGSAPSTTNYTYNVYVPVAGTINIINTQVYCGTAGTNENWTANLRKNDTTDYAIQTLSSTASMRNFVNTGLAAPVAAGDYLQVKLVNPAWATNPANCSFSGVAYVSP